MYSQHAPQRMQQRDQQNKWSTCCWSFGSSHWRCRQIRGTIRQFSDPILREGANKPYGTRALLVNPLILK